MTSGGHAVGCAAALATIDIMEREGVADQALQAGRYLVEQLRELAGRHEALSADSVRGIGMMAAVDIDVDAVGAEFGPAAHRQFVRERLFVREYLDSQTIGFLPSLICTTQDIDEIIERLEAGLVATESELS